MPKFIPKPIANLIYYAVNILKNNKILTFISFFSFFLLLFFSPVLGVYFLVPFTLYFIYIGEFKNICVAWLFLFSSWYLAFTACMMGFDGPLIIKSDFLGCGPKSKETLALLSYIDGRYLGPVLSYSSFNDFWNATLGLFCIQTYFILSIFCSKLGISIYIPSLFKGLLTLYKFINRNNPPAQCSSEKESGNSSIFNRMKNFFWGAGEKKGPTEPIINQPGTSGRWSPKYSPGVSPTSMKPSFTERPNTATSTGDSSYLGRFFGKTPKPNLWNECKKMEDKPNKNLFINISKTVKHGKCVTYREINVPGFYKMQACDIQPATADEVKEANILRDATKKK